MFKSLDIQKDMDVVGLDGKHVGTVDHLETADRIILSKDAAHHCRYNRPAFPGGSNEVKIDKTATTQSSQRQRYNYVYCATYCATDRPHDAKFDRATS
jgi:hypothetical protein